MLKLIVVGRLVHALERGQPLEMFTGAIAVNEAGRIVRVDKGDVAVVAGDDVLGNRDATSDDESGGDENVQPDVDLLSYREKLEQRWKDELAVDCRVGGVRYVNCGLGLDLPLLEWLERYTFPKETEFQDARVAELTYPAAVRRHLSFGSTTCCYYGTIHLEATKRLVDVIEHLGQRALIGKVNMDRNAPAQLTESTEESLRDTRAFVEYVRGKNNSLLEAILTPRFAPSCTSECMCELGALAKKEGLAVQTHLSENLAEIEWVRQLFPDAASYTDVYDRHGLLTPRTVLAHGIHLSADELKLLRERGSGISHCPNSNFGISSGICNVRHLWASGVAVGLGTDVSGGHHPSMIDSMKNAILASKALSLPKSSHDNVGLPLTVHDVLYLATLGSAAICGLHDTIGNFLPGKDFDAVLVDLRQFHEQLGIESAQDVTYDHHKHALEQHEAFVDGNIDLWQHDDLMSCVERFVYLGDDRNVKKVWVRGRLVKGSYD